MRDSEETMSARLSGFHQLAIDAPEEDALLIAGALEAFSAPAPQSVSARRMGRVAPWRIEAIFDEAPDERKLAAFFRAVAPQLAYTLAPLPDEDWVALSQSKLPPIKTRRFYVHAGAVPATQALGSRHEIGIEAGLAFGTGHHATTQGCLWMLEELSRRAAAPRRVLDLGAGTALLAIAAQRLWPAARIVASDIDPIAVEVARANARANHAPQIRPVVAAGFNHPAIAAASPFDLVLANILALPLRRLAREAARRVRGGGSIVLSGLLDEQASLVVEAYRGAGFALGLRRDLEGWTSLLMKRL